MPTDEVKIVLELTLEESQELVWLLGLGQRVRHHNSKGHWTYAKLCNRVQYLLHHGNPPEDPTKIAGSRPKDDWRSEA